ncbi:MAG TPA: aspartate kinase [Anaerolineales bacterium]|nr:aspartate kinase [Anaerolineales bacterium]
MKFGGTSVGSPEAMAQVVAIVKQQHTIWSRLVVVTSALAGVTNRLLKSASQAALGDNQTYQQNAREFLDEHMAIANHLLPDHKMRFAVKHELEQLILEFTNLCHAIEILGEASPRALDAVAAQGERMAVRVLAAGLESVGVATYPVDATRIISTDDFFTDAHPEMSATRLRTQRELKPLLNAGKVPVVTGFIASTPTGVTTTLGRGGSDYSAAILGVALEATEVWIFTDVDGVMSADPRLAPEAHTIEQLSYREVAELAYFGARVLHPKSIRPVIEAGINLRVLNTFNPSHPGTLILADPNGGPAGMTGVQTSGKIKAVTVIRNQRLVTVEGRGMLGVPGVAARTFAAVAATGTSVPLITQASSEQSICFAVPGNAIQRVLSELEASFKAELARRDIDRIWATEEVVIITIVGAGMRNTPGISGRIFSALGGRDVNVIAIAQGSSEVSISVVVDALDTQAALNAIHSLIP